MEGNCMKIHPEKQELDEKNTTVAPAVQQIKNKLNR